jgi:AhpD family alkylhydroperoxidase
MPLSQINECAYCLDQHTRVLQEKGVRVGKLVLVQVWREGEVLFDERERAALAWAETVTRVAETAIPEWIINPHVPYLARRNWSI